MVGELQLAAARHQLSTSHRMVSLEDDPDVSYTYNRRSCVGSRRP